jgi:hypothetical protein
MNNPRATPYYGQPINYETGLPLTSAQQGRLEQLNDAGDLLYSIMHDCEGSQPTNTTYTSRRMATAATHLEIALMLAKKAALENP